MEIVTVATIATVDSYIGSIGLYLGPPAAAQHVEVGLARPNSRPIVAPQCDNEDIARTFPPPMVTLQHDEVDIPRFEKAHLPPSLMPMPAPATATPHPR